MYLFETAPTISKLLTEIWVLLGAASGGVLLEKLFLEISQNSQKYTCARVSFLINFIKTETLAQVFSCEFCEISKNTFLQNTSGRLLLC